MLYRPRSSRTPLRHHRARSLDGCLERVASVRTFSTSLMTWPSYIIIFLIATEWHCENVMCWITVAEEEQARAIVYAHWNCRTMFSRMLLRFCLQEKALCRFSGNASYAVLQFIMSLYTVYEFILLMCMELGHAIRRQTAGQFGPDLAKKLSQLVKMEKNVMRSMELVGRERMEVAVSYSFRTFR